MICSAHTRYIVRPCARACVRQQFVFHHQRCYVFFHVIHCSQHYVAMAIFWASYSRANWKCSYFNRIWVMKTCQRRGGAKWTKLQLLHFPTSDSILNTWIFLQWCQSYIYLPFSKKYCAICKFIATLIFLLHGGQLFIIINISKSYGGWFVPFWFLAPRTRQAKNRQLTSENCGARGENMLISGSAGRKVEI